MSFNLTTHHLLPPLTISNKITITHSQSSTNPQNNPNPKPPFPFSNHLLSLALAVATVTSPLPSTAIPSLNNLLPPSPPPAANSSTPFSQSKTLITGLDIDGRIRPCPSINPGCVSSNPKSSSFAFPWTIPERSLDNALQVFDEMSP